MNHCRPYCQMNPLTGIYASRGNAVGYRYASPDGNGFPVTYSVTHSHTVHSSLITAHSSFTFSAKEKDSETGLTVTSLRSDSSSSLSKGQTSLSLHSLIRRFGARYYSSDLSIWLSVDPMSDKYPSLSPYVYCADNPVKLVDPNGEEFVGTDGKKVNVKQDKNGQIHIGDNASEDLKRMASMINNSGSKTAAKQFMKLANNRCKIHFQIIQGERDGSRIGYHQAHDSQGNKLDWVGDRDNGYFEGTPAIQSILPREGLQWDPILQILERVF